MAIQLITGRPRSSARGNALNGSLNSCALTHLPSDKIRKIVPRKDRHRPERDDDRRDGEFPDENAIEHAQKRAERND